MLPIVRFFFACDSAICDLADYKWAISNPWHTVQMPRGMTKGHGQKELWLYAQLAGGLGDFDLGVELRYYEPGRADSFVLGRSGVERRTFSHKLEIHEVVFQMVKVPFPRVGQYEFRLMAQGQELQNGTAFLDVLPG
jgi:hypothetical protein